ncbi:MAG: T9SS type A sorting domain-containing protein [Ignavibacteria bacterium]|nr:T9SS type A sorting domain-containing protein [Ignavibacteria bacterium]
MKRIILTLIAIFLISSYSVGQVKVNFNLQNPRFESGKFIVDLYATIPAGQTWSPGNTCLRMNYWTSNPSNALSLIPENPVDNANMNISNNSSYDNITTTSILNDTAVSFNILLLSGQPAYAFSAGNQWLGSIKFNIAASGACLNMSFVDNSAVFNNLTGLVYNTGWTYTNPIPCFVVGIHNISTEIPKSFMLSQNYPNPFNPVTMIKFSLPHATNVSLKVYDMLGREIANLVNGFKNAGEYIVDFDASSLTSGVYFYRMEAGSFVEIKRMVVVK